MKIIKFFSLFCLIITTSACTSVVTIPQTGDLQTVIAYSSNEDEAVKIANDRARRICALQNQTIKIVDLDTIYQGVDPGQKMLIKLAKNVLPKNKTSPPYTPEGYTYKATLTFRCI